MTGEKGFVQQFCAEVWWLVLLRGIALLLLGGFLLFRPGSTALILVQFLGAYFIVDGLFSVYKSIRGRNYMKGWGWGIFMGFLEILAGIIVFARPLASAVLTVSFLVYLIAFGAILFGLLGIITGVRVRKEIKGEWSMIVGGLMAIIFGIILLINPLASALVFVTVMGAFALLGGLIQIFVSFRLRKIGKKGLEAFA